jgi:hypothetical protein
MDEAYLRRIAYKVAILDPTRDQLAEITRRFCDRSNIEWTEEAVQHLMDKLYAPGNPTPHGCYPRDVITTVMDEAEFQGRGPVLDTESIDTACALYLGIGNVIRQDEPVIQAPTPAPEPQAPDEAAA